MLERVFDVRFTATTQDEIRSFDAWLVLNYGRTHAAWASRLRVPCYMAIDTQPAASSSLDGIELVVANRSEVPSTIAGRTIRSAHAGTFEPLPGWLPQTTPLASIRGAPVWGIRGAPPSRNHFVGIPVPELGDGQPLFQCFDDGHLAEIIPLLSFLRELTDDPRWTEPPLSACFMFDDPNLHWPTYGHLDFAEVAGQAARHRYHVAFATIPLDGWFVHSKTAALFRDHPEALSLLIHGNDHVKEELARRMSDAARAAMLRQALHRIVNLEKRSGVYVSRIMAPPHGACSEETLAQMCMSGFEAACISKGSLRHYNPRAPWLATVGVGP
ncbi:MAG: hypothetical protein ACXW2Q_12990, partial [Thermoanaerobaculia bacterium]